MTKQRKYTHVIYAATSALAACQMCAELRDERQIALDPRILISAEHHSGVVAPYKQRLILAIRRVKTAQQVLFVREVPVRICAVCCVDMKL